MHTQIRYGLILLIATATLYASGRRVQHLRSFLPEHYVVAEEVYGDLNGDGLEDCVLVVQSDSPASAYTDGTIPEGIVVLINNGNGYAKLTENLGILRKDTMMHQDSGAETTLDVKISDGDLLITYSLSQTRRRCFTFRCADTTCTLIAYDGSELTNGRIDSQCCIRFLTKEKLIKVNKNKNAQPGEEVFRLRWKQIAVNKQIELAEIESLLTLAVAN